MVDAGQLCYFLEIPGMNYEEQHANSMGGRKKKLQPKPGPEAICTVVFREFRHTCRLLLTLLAVRELRPSSSAQFPIG